jgi:hypothetical protein
MIGFDVEYFCSQLVHYLELSRNVVSGLIPTELRFDCARACDVNASITNNFNDSHLCSAIQTIRPQSLIAYIHSAP